MIALRARSKAFRVAMDFLHPCKEDGHPTVERTLDDPLPQRVLEYSPVRRKLEFQVLAAWVMIGLIVVAFLFMLAAVIVRA